MKNIGIRAASEADLPEINSIFNYYVAKSTCVWTTTPCTEAERKVWYEEHGEGMPILVAESNGRIIGWGALSKFPTSCTYYRTVEDSVYVHADFHRQGIGGKLLGELIHCAEQHQVNTVIAVTSTDQEPSIQLHRKFGFQEVGRFHRVGRKFNRWLDDVYLQLLLTSAEQGHMNER